MGQDFGGLGARGLGLGLDTKTSIVKQFSDSQKRFSGKIGASTVEEAVAAIKGKVSVPLIFENCKFASNFTGVDLDDPGRPQVVCNDDNFDKIVPVTYTSGKDVTYKM